jgi:hemophore-related protein
MLLSRKLIVASAGLALSLSAGAGLASAQPDVTAVVNTTCSYPQVVAALNAQSPADGAEFTSNPLATSWLNQFLASPPDQRQQMIDQVQTVPGAQQYTSLVVQVASTCKNF